MRRRRPFKLRFLFPLQWAVIALGVAGVVRGLRSAVCSMLPGGAQCPAIVPEWLGMATFAVALLAVADSAYRYWLDFHQGEYYMDVIDPDWRDR